MPVGYVDVHVVQELNVSTVQMPSQPSTKADSLPAGTASPS